MAKLKWCHQLVISLICDPTTTRLTFHFTSLSKYLHFDLLTSRECYQMCHLHFFYKCWRKSATSSIWAIITLLYCWKFASAPLLGKFDTKINFHSVSVQQIFQMSYPGGNLIICGLLKRTQNWDFISSKSVAAAVKMWKLFLRWRLFVRGFVLKPNKTSLLAEVHWLGKDYSDTLLDWLGLRKFPAKNNIAFLDYLVLFPS